MTIPANRLDFISKLIECAADKNLDCSSFIYSYMDQPYIPRFEPELNDDHCIAEFYRVEEDADQTIIKVRYELNQRGQELYDACGLKITEEYPDEVELDDIVEWRYHTVVSVR